jgi:hypothetical protein
MARLKNKKNKNKYFMKYKYYTGCLKKTAMEIKKAVVHHKRG